MAIAVSTIIDKGLACSAQNRPQTLAENNVELVRVVDAAQAALFAYAAKVSPSTCSDLADVVFDGMGWPFPANADTIWRVVGLPSTVPAMTLGTPIYLVPIEDIQVATPAVYRIGQKYYGAGQTADPTAGSIRCYFSVVPTTLAAPADNLDARIPDRFARVYEYEVAAYLARKDGGRPSEGQGPSELDQMVAERDRWVDLFADWCDHQTVNETRRNDVVRFFPAEERKVLKAALTPGIAG